MKTKFRNQWKFGDRAWFVIWDGNKSQKGNKILKF